MSETWKGQSKGKLSGYKFFAFLIKTFGVGSAYVFLKIIALYYFLFVPKAFKSIRYYFQERLHFSAWKSIRSIYTNYVWFGQTLIDKAVIMAGIPNNITVEHEGEEHLHQLAKDGKGGFLISAHLGNWEVAGFLLKRVETKFNILMYENERGEIKKYLDQSYKSNKMNFIFISEDLSHIFAINKAIKNGEIICLHGDRFLPGSKTFTANFLGENARFPTGPFEMPFKLNAPVSFVYAMKESNTHYHFFSEKPFVETTSPEKIFERYIDSLHAMVKRYPQQWFNYYHFWEV